MAKAAVKKSEGRGLAGCGSKKAEGCANLNGEAEILKKFGKRLT